ncbi:unnamed protein product, partial [Polarella glacialis]
GMVGRFESAELKKEALAHEDLCAGQGLLGRCTCVVGTILTVMGLVSPLLSSDGLLWGRSGVASPVLPTLVTKDLSESPSQEYSSGGRDFSTSSTGSRDFSTSSFGADSGFGDFGRESMPSREESTGMRLDYSLLAIL